MYKEAAKLFVCIHSSHRKLDGIVMYYVSSIKRTDEQSQYMPDCPYTTAYDGWFCKQRK